MHIKVTVGRKTNFAFACIWSILAIICFVKGELFLGALEALLAIHDFRDANRGTKVTLFELQTSKEAK